MRKLNPRNATRPPSVDLRNELKKGGKKTLESKISQPVSHSMLEAIVGTGVGFIVNVYAQHLVFPYLGIHIPWSVNVSIAVIFTGISIARSFILRRVFNKLHVLLALKG